MFLSSSPFSGGRGELPKRPRKDFSPCSKGYPEERDPQAEKPTGLLNGLTPYSEHKYRQKYAARYSG